MDEILIWMKHFILSFFFAYFFGLYLNLVENENTAKKNQENLEVENYDILMENVSDILTFSIIVSLLVYYFFIFFLSRQKIIPPPAKKKPPLPYTYKNVKVLQVKKKLMKKKK